MVMRKLMSVKLDLIAKALYITLKEAPVAKTIEFAEEVFLDLDSHGKLVGIEMLNPGTIRFQLPKIAATYKIPALQRVRAKALEQAFVSV